MSSLFRCLVITLIASTCASSHLKFPGTTVNSTVWPSGNMAGEETALTSGLDSNRASGLPPESETVHNPRSGAAGPTDEGNDPGGPPTGAHETAGDREITNIDGRPSAEGDCLQLVAGAESNRLAIGGKEGGSSTLGAGDGDGMGFGKRPAVQQHRPSRGQLDFAHKHDGGAIGSDCKGGAAGPAVGGGSTEPVRGSKVHAEADEARGRWRRLADMPQRGNTERDHPDDRDRERRHPRVSSMCRCRRSRVCGATVSNAPSSANETSPISRTRCLRSFCRHRRITVATAAGTVAGSAVQSGSFIRMRANVSETSSPSNARLAVSIS